MVPLRAALRASPAVRVPALGGRRAGRLRRPAGGGQARPSPGGYGV
jgi:hypothetical protein